MKTVIFVCVLIAAAMAGGREPLTLTLGRSSYGSNDAYTILCAGGSGPWTYRVDGLPSGAYLNGDKIVISSSTVSGTYQLTITATDSTGATVQRSVTLNVVVSGSSSTTIGSTGFTSGVIGVGGVAGIAGTDGSVSWNSGSTTGSTSGSITWSSSGSGTGSYPGGSGSSPSGTGGYPSGGSPAGSGGYPSGGSPGTGGSPSGGSPSGGSPSGPGRLDGILSAFGGPAGTPNLNYPGNRYPEPNYPTGGSPSGFNPTPGQIGSSQTPPTSGNRNPITPDDVALRAASERHQNAIKAITNLLSIVDQAKANKNQA